MVADAGYSGRASLRFMQGTCKELEPDDKRDVASPQHGRKREST
jgi:hypothetical protein